MRRPFLILAAAGLTALALGCAVRRPTPPAPHTTQPQPPVAERPEPSEVVVRYFGHSCFLVSEVGGLSVLVDPFHEDLGYPAPEQYADVVLVTLDDPAHNNLEAVRGEPAQIATQEGETEAKGVVFEGVTGRAWRNSAQSYRGDTVMYAWQMAGMRFCHLGALAVGLTDDESAALGPVDVLFVPIGGGPALDAELAMGVIRRLNPRVILPMQYQTDATDAASPLAPVETFLDLIPPNWTVGQLKMNVIELKRQEVLTKGAPPRVLVLSP